MKDWEKALVHPQASLRDALQVIDAAATQMALVVDIDKKLLGALSDGDVRRALIAGHGLEESVSTIMNKSPTCARLDESRDTIHALMRRHGFRQVPILDDASRLVGLETLDDFLRTESRENWVIIMAGGLGTRLQELTTHTPKPMLKVGEKPILHTIIQSFIDHGFAHFYLAVNYKAEQIEEYFGDGSNLGIKIRYIKEQQRLGTAGALSLLPSTPTSPFIVTNADILTKVDFGQLVDKHVEHGADATMTVRDYEMQVPFGVVREHDGRIESIEEKPVQRFTVSAGMYVLSPNILELVPHNTFFDMPTLFERASQKRLNARCHRIHGYWLDIGRMTDYERANTEYVEVFK